MRDFRDAKTMAHTLRNALKSKAIEITHSDSLELVAKAFGFNNWNILAALIAAASSERARADQTPHCSLCGKGEHEVRKLIHGLKASICDACFRRSFSAINRGIEAARIKTANDND
ncbi:glyoxalase superfamily protein [Bradyrhizobium sp. SZCCHNR2009]|uniref:glyoxalase superfamily protein n=1 Tax=Bradyrhizobium sp. SZCCHNR2009 TaxID=3057375 RepID=UPI0028ED91C4|nr:glyoxalase superfamily protein [Bradyrhizobium sp. SZCCHNR2009]